MNYTLLFRITKKGAIKFFNNIAPLYITVFATFWLLIFYPS